jgi:Ca-activated chloride channel homolog
MTDYQFGEPAWLLLLLAIPLLSWLRGKSGRAPALLFPTVNLLRDLSRPARSAAGGLSLGLLLLSLIAGILALARPQHIVPRAASPTEGIAIALTLDISASMRTPDFYIGGQPVDRMAAAKRVINDFVKGRPNDRMGLVVFAGVPYLPCPLTLDHDWLRSIVDRIQADEGSGSHGGTAIGSGIAAAALRLSKEKEVKSKIIVLVTDGANNSGRLSPQDAARLAKSGSVKIYPISIGTPGQHLIPVPGRPPINSGREEFDEPTLIEVANITGGQFFRAQDLDTLKRIFRDIDDLEKSKVERKADIETHDAYHPYALVAAALLAISLLLRSTLLRASP